MQKKQAPTSAGLPRREFIKKTAAVAAGAVASTSLFKTRVFGQAPSPGRVIGANDRITVAVVGVGEGIGSRTLDDDSSLIHHHLAIADGGEELEPVLDDHDRYFSLVPDASDDGLDRLDLVRE